MPFVVWQDPNPWDDTDPRDELPQTLAGKYAFTGRTYGRQREDFALDLVSLSPDPLVVRIEPRDLVGTNGATAAWDRHLTFHDVTWMPTRHGGVAPDMLPAMNGGRGPEAPRRRADRAAFAVAEVLLDDAEDLIHKANRNGRPVCRAKCERTANRAPTAGPWNGPAYEARRRKENPWRNRTKNNRIGAARPAS